MIIGLVVIAFLVFFNAINHPFVHDDLVFIVQNPLINRLDHLQDIFLQANQQVSAGINSYYRPILEIVYRLEYKLFGFNAAGFHLVNVLLHIANGLLLLAILRGLKFSQWLAFGVSLLFLIHPVQTEAVACVAGISNLLAALFVLTALYFYIKEESIVALAFLSLALLTKEQAVIVPLLFVLLDWYQGKKNRYGLWFMAFILTVGFLWLRSHITGAHMLQDILQSPGELRLRLLAIPRTILMYLRLIVAPHDLHYYRNTDILQPNFLGFIVLGGLSAMMIYGIQKIKANSRDVLFGLGWFIICLLPILNVIPLVNEYSFILTAEHFLYLPMVGILLVLGKILVSLRGSDSDRSNLLNVKKIASLRPADSVRNDTLLVKLFWIIVVILGSLSIYQNTFWRGEIPLFERMIRFEPNFGRGHILLASAYEKSKQYDLAIKHYSQALDIMTAYSKKSVNEKATRFYQGFMKGLLINIGQCLMVQGQFENALEHYLKSLEINSNDPEVLNNIAICYLQMGDKAQAEQYLKMALGFNPTFAPARSNLNRLIEK